MAPAHEVGLPRAGLPPHDCCKNDCKPQTFILPHPGGQRSQLKVRVWWGALSGGAGGGSCRPLSDSGGCGHPLARDRILRLGSIFARPLLASLPRTRAPPGGEVGSSSRTPTRKDASSKSGHNHRCWGDLSLGGRHLAPQLCISQRAHPVASALRVTYTVPPESPAPPGHSRCLACGRRTMHV